MCFYLTFLKFLLAMYVCSVCVCACVCPGEKSRDSKTRLEAGAQTPFPVFILMRDLAVADAAAVDVPRVCACVCEQLQRLFS